MAEKSSSNNEANTNSPSTEQSLPASSPSTVATPATTPAATASSWWGSWIDTAKSKSASVFEAVKKDLDELSEVVKTEASNASTALGLNDQESTVGVMKKSFSSFLGQVTDVLLPQLNVDVEADAVILTKDGLLTLTGFPKHLAELQSDDNTYLKEPNDEMLGNYNRWLEIIEQDQFTENRLGKHLTSSQILNEKYLTLVPDEVSHMEFWKRYLFKRALLEDAIANAELAEKKAKSEINSNKTISPEKTKTIVQTMQPKKIAIDEEEGIDAVRGVDDTNIEDDDDILDDKSKWEIEDFSAANIDLSEEEQARLLEEYEQEIKEREKGKIDSAEDALSGVGDVVKKTNNTKQKMDAKVNIKNNKTKQVVANQTNQVKGKNANTKNNSTSAKSQTQISKNTKNTTTTTKDNKPATSAAVATTTTATNKNSESKIVDNHFSKEEPSSSNSDEDWEKFPTETEK